jgi:hypothetical protein
MVSRKIPLSPAPLPFSPQAAASRFAVDGQVERAILEKLQSHPGLHVCALTVHRGCNGLCLEGRVELMDPVVDMAGLLAEIDTATPILNRVIVSSPMMPAM